MTLQKPITLTAAEEAFLAHYEGAMGSLQGDAAMTRARDVAVSTIRKAGLPTRRNEAWHYTDLRNLLKTFPAPADETKTSDKKHALEAAKPLLASTLLPFFNGQFDDDLADNLPDGLSAAMSLSAPNMRKGDTVAALNTALVGEGVVFSVEEGAELNEPLALSFHQISDEAHAASSRVAVTAASGSTSTWVEHHASAAGIGHLVNAITDVTIGKDATLTWLILQEHGDATSHLAQLNVVLRENAQFNLFIINTGAALVRQEMNVRVEGEGADFQLRGINLLAGNIHCDLTMVLDHLPENTTSEQIVRNVVMDRAKGVFQGQIRVAKEAQKTDAKMACNTLLLSDDAEFSAKPELEIFADDVACGHGATVTEINPDHMFYLMARGVSEASARALLVKAFVAELLEELEDEAIAEAIEARLDIWLKAQS